MKVFAFAHHAPDEILMKLCESGIDREDVYVVRVDEVIKRKNKRNHLIFLNTASFNANREQLEIRNVQSYVFDNPLRLAQFNFTPADYKMEEYFHVDGFSLIPCVRLDRCPDIAINRKPFDIVAVASEYAKQQITFLMQFMTFIYSMPSETHQKPVKELVCKWMASKEPFSKYCKRIETLRNTVHLTDKQVRRLSDLLSSPTAVLYRDALQQPGDEDEVAKEYKISAYEMRYIRSINGTLKS